MKRIICFEYDYGGGCYLSLTEADKGSIIIALDEADLRPIDVQIYDIDDDGNYVNMDDGFDDDANTILKLSYEIKGSDNLNIQALSHKFARDNIVPALKKALPLKKSKLFSLRKCRIVS